MALRHGALALHEQLFHLGGGARLAEQVALRLRAALAAQEFKLGRRLDALGRGGDAEAAAEAGHGAHDGERIVARGDILDERAVDLDLVEWEASEIAERRIAGAEIVE